MKSSIFAFLAAVAAPALAHYRWTSLIAGGVTTGQYEFVRTYTTYNSPVTGAGSITSAGITCNTGSAPVAGIQSVAAGSTVGLAVDNTLYHPGVINVYMGIVPAGQTAATWDGSGNAWFRISQLTAPVVNGMLSFPAEEYSSWTFQIPAATPSGDYLIRVEHLALHVAGTYGGLQVYLSCAQVTVTGGGSGSPGPLVAFPGYYTGYEPGILIDIYAAQSSYTQPGPPLWTGGSGGGAPAPTTTPAKTIGSTTKPSTMTTTTTTKTTTTTATGPTQTHYGQCGGTGWTGPTVCAAGYTCTASGSYYSQCL